MIEGDYRNPNTDFRSNDQIFVYAAAGHDLWSSSAVFAEDQGAFTLP